MSDLSSVTNVLGAMITPALLISAGGTLVLSTSNRLTRVVDRVRTLARDAEKLPEPVENAALEAKRSLITSQLDALAERALILRSSLSALYLAIGLLVATSIGIGALTLLQLGYAWFPIGLAMLGACALLWGSVLLVKEGRLAIASTLEEMRYVQNTIHAKRPPAGE